MFLDNVLRRKPKLRITTLLSGPFKGRAYHTLEDGSLGRRVLVIDGKVHPHPKGGFVKQRMTRSYRATQAKRTVRRQRAATAFRAPVGTPYEVGYRLSIRDINRRRAKLGLELLTGV